MIEPKHSWPRGLLLALWAPLTCFTLVTVYRMPAAVRGVSVAPESNRAVVSRFRRSGSALEVWSLNPSPRIENRIELDLECEPLAILDDSRVILTVFDYNTDSGTFLVVDMASGEHLWTHRAPRGKYNLQVTSAANRFAILEENEITVFDAESYEVIHRVSSPRSQQFRSIQFSPRGQFLLTGFGIGLQCLDANDSWKVVYRSDELVYRECFAADELSVFAVEMPRRDRMEPIDEQGAAFRLIEGHSLRLTRIELSSGRLLAETPLENVPIGALVATPEGVLFEDNEDPPRLKIWEGGSLTASPVSQLLWDRPALGESPEIASRLDGAKLWGGDNSGRLRTFDVFTDELSGPLNLGFISGTSTHYAACVAWIVWSVVWFARRTQQPNRWGPLVDLTLTIAPLLAYCAIKTQVEIEPSEFLEPVTWSLIAAPISVLAVWFVFGLGAVSGRLPWTVGGMAVCYAAAVLVTGGYWVQGFLWSTGIAALLLIIGLSGARQLVSWRLQSTVSRPQTRVALASPIQWRIRDGVLLIAAIALFVRVIMSVPPGDLGLDDRTHTYGVLIDIAAILFNILAALLILLSPWSWRKRFATFAVLSFLHMVIWSPLGNSPPLNAWLSWTRVFAAFAAIFTFAVFGVLRLHGYRLQNTSRPRSEFSVGT